jgi:D-alanine--poly(phosphoribitol) ligase subunit 1
MIDVCHLFLDQARARPNHLAVVTDQRAVTYGELADQAQRLAAVLSRFGSEPKVLVHLPQQAEAYAAMFAAGLAGGFYAPTNIEAPLAKQRMLLGQFAPDVVISTRALYASLIPEGNGPPLIDVDALPAPAAAPVNRPGRLAYVIFTSGSSGIPKGVVISRAALANYVDWALREMAVSPEDRWSQHPNIAFDLSVLDIYGALCGGATLYPLTGAKDRLLPALAVARHRLTIWNSVPSVIGLMIKANQVTAGNFSSLRLLTFCGEPLLPEHLDAIFAARPDVSVHNTYGPTEATVSCSLLRLDAGTYRNACQTTVAIGDAIDNMGLYLADGPTPDEGEMLITGPQLAEGYWGDPATTGKAFRDRTIDGTTRRAYHTGDWFRRIDGHMMFVRRMDSQVKVSGHRLDLEEVNAAIRKCGIVTACTLLIEGRLHAFLEVAESQTVDIEKLRADLLQLLDRPAVPAEFHLMPLLPRNANDKIDALALSATIAPGT